MGREGVWAERGGQKHSVTHVIRRVAFEIERPEQGHGSPAQGQGEAEHGLLVYQVVVEAQLLEAPERRRLAGGGRRQGRRLLARDRIRPHVK